MLEQKSITIGTTEYRVTLMDAVSALKVQTKLVKLLGHGAVSLIGSTENAQEKVKQLIPLLMDNFNDELVNEIVLMLFEKGVFIAQGEFSKKLDFSNHFIGNPLDMWKLAGFIIGANFGLGEQFESILRTIGEEELKAES